MYFGGCLSTSNSSIPHDSLWPLAGWCASLSWLRCPSPARKDGHAVLFAQAFVRAPVGLDLLAQTAFTLNDFQQLAVSLGLRRGRVCTPSDRRLSLCQLGELLELQLQVVLLLKMLELLLQLQLLLLELSLLLLPRNAGTAGTAGWLRRGKTMQLQVWKKKKSDQRICVEFYDIISYGFLNMYYPCSALSNRIPVFAHVQENCSSYRQPQGCSVGAFITFGGRVNQTHSNSLCSTQTASALAMEPESGQNPDCSLPLLNTVQHVLISTIVFQLLTAT